MDCSSEECPLSRSLDIKYFKSQPVLLGTRGFLPLKTSVVWILGGQGMNLINSNLDTLAL